MSAALPDLAFGQVWEAPDGERREVYGLTWADVFYVGRPGNVGACRRATWRAWARKSGARVVEVAP